MLRHVPLHRQSTAAILPTTVLGPKCNILCILVKSQKTKQVHASEGFVQNLKACSHDDAEAARAAWTFQHVGGLPNTVCACLPSLPKCQESATAVAL